MMQKFEKIYLTGSSGFFGKKLSENLKDQGFTVIPLLNKSGSKWRLGDNPQFNSGETSWVVHAAWDMKTEEESFSEKGNLEGSRILFEEAHKLGVRIIFISSMSAFLSAKSVYGKTKFAVEKIALNFNGIIIRPGLLWGADGSSVGVLNGIKKLVDCIPIIPYVHSSRIALYATQVDELSRYICDMVSGQKDWSLDNRIHIFACPERLNLKDVILRIAIRNKKKLLLVPLPGFFILIVLFILRTLKMKLFKIDSLVGLLNPDPNPEFVPEAKFMTPFYRM